MTDASTVAPLLSDGPIALLILLLLNRFPDTISRLLQMAGGVFLIYLAWASYRQWRQHAVAGPDPNHSIPQLLRNNRCGDGH